MVSHFVCLLKPSGLSDSPAVAAERSTTAPQEGPNAWAYYGPTLVGDFPRASRKVEPGSHAHNSSGTGGTSAAHRPRFTRQANASQPGSVRDRHWARAVLVRLR